MVRADISSEHDTGSTYHDLGYFVGTVASAGRTSICNIPVTCLPFTDLRGQVIQPYYLTATATSVSNPNPSPQAYNAILASVLREQNYSFWSAEQDISNLSAGHYGTYSATANKSIRRHRCAPDGRPIAPSTIPARRSAAACLSKATPTSTISPIISPGRPN